MKFSRSFAVAMLAAVTIVAGLGSRALAHRLMLECRLDGERLRVEAFFEDDTPAQNAAINVQSTQGAIAASGQSDERGAWSCLRPEPGRYLVRVQSHGHAAERYLEIAAEAREAAPTPTANQPEPRDLFTLPTWGRVTLGLAAIAACYLLARSILGGRKRITSGESR